MSRSGDAPFAVTADAYDRFMGRYSAPLAHLFLDLVDPLPGERVLDVGCGPGALLGPLIERLGPAGVTGIDPAESFVRTARARWPAVDVRQAAAESLPFPDGTFDHTMAQLVVHFLTDPVRGLREMARVTRAGGLVAACVWDFGGGRSPISAFWEAAREQDPAAPDESALPGAGAGRLPDLLRRAGLEDVRAAELTIAVRCPSFAEWWAPFTLGVGPAGVHLARLDQRERDDLRERCRRRWPAGAFDVRATAWAAVGRARPVTSASAPRSAGSGR